MRLSSWLRRGVSILVALAATPLWAASGCDDLAGMPINFNAPWSLAGAEGQSPASVKEVLQTNCGGCHFHPSDFDVSDEEVDAIFKLVGRYVLPGRPAESLMFQKLNCSEPPFGRRMPPGGSLDLATQGLIYDWIAQGALGEEPPGSIDRDFIFRDGAESLR